MPAQPIAFAAGVISAKPARYKGCALRETAGSTAVVRLWDNPAAASGVLLDTIGFAAGASHHLGYDWIVAKNGIFAEVVSGTVEGVVFIG